MKKLSIIIVNYNVSHFLEQSLLSVFKASKNIDVEVIVVDNNSVDGSIEMVEKKFPKVKLIANKQNVGFSKANNQAIKISEGQYVLLLNPDTVVQEDTFEKCLTFMDSKPDAGAIGVYMVDGKGNYLPESKRSLPTPAVAFFKIFGLSALFPSSRRFGKYHLGYLDKNKIHEVEVLSGAFMMIRCETLEKAGLLDESFFMYGEDIDLSYRITKAGYKNYYYPEARIIHYKGESTKKSSLNYVFIFYQAMLIFAKKHFSGKNFRLYSSIIRLAIYFRAAVSVAGRTLKALLFPLIDIIMLWSGIYIIKEYWVSYVRFGSGADYPYMFNFVIVPAYILIWVLSIYFSGGYDRPFKNKSLWKGLGAGTLIILVIYALLPESLRFSRAMIILGFSWAALSLPFYRHLLSLTGIKLFTDINTKQKRFAIIGSYSECERVAAILRKTNPDLGFIGIVTIDKPVANQNVIGNIDQITEIIAVFQINEIIFCLKDMEAKEIINLMTTLPDITEYKIAPPESSYIIGSGSIHSSSDLYLLNVNAISSKANKRNKRVFDFSSAILMLLISPVILPFQKSPKQFLANCIGILSGDKSWVGYSSSNRGNYQLPALKKGVFKPADGIKLNITDDEMLNGLNLIYARDYQISTDIKILFKNFRNLGNK